MTWGELKEAAATYGLKDSQVIIVGIDHEDVQGSNITFDTYDPEDSIVFIEGVY